MNYKDYYQILGVAKNDDDQTIKRAYRRLARQYHPDKNPGNPKAEEKFKEINEAYEVLGDADNRSKYDRLGSNYQRYQQMGGNPSDFDFSQWTRGGAGSGGYQQVNIDFGDLFSGGFSDFFNSIFGSSPGQGAQYRQAGQDELFGRSGGQNVNLDIQQTIDIILEEAYRGTTRTFNHDNSQFTAKIPPGAKTGTKIRIKGKGNKGPYGQGDLYLLVNVQVHDEFQRMGNNLRTDVGIDVLTAVLGGKIELPTLDGSVQLTIPAGTQGGQLFRLKGKGMPQLRDREMFGDLLAKIKILVPTDLDGEQLRLYQQLAALQNEKT